jgi:cell division septation protein DedD
MSPKHLIAAILVALVSVPLSAQSVEKGIDAWQRGDFADAVSIWRPLAEAGDADAQFNLGQAYRLGRGIPTNVAESRKWFEAAAAQGHVDAETTLGLLLYQNGDQADGLKWLKLAADQDEPRAMLVYGTALYNGDGVTQDPVLGYAYVRRAAAQGLEPARETLAQLDNLMSDQDRKHGATMAQSLGKAAGAASFGGARPTSKRGAERKVSMAAPTQTASTEPPKKAAPATAAGPTAEPVGEQPNAAKRALVKAPKASPSKPIETASLAPAKKSAPEPATAPPTSAPTTGAWRIQLGAFSQKGNAQALYQKLAGSSALAGRKPFYIVAGPITRLQVGPFESKAAAAAACKTVGSACFPVRAN